MSKADQTIYDGDVRHGLSCDEQQCVHKVQMTYGLSRGVMRSRKSGRTGGCVRRRAGQWLRESFQTSETRSGTLLAGHEIES